jgi:hypothetical protein
MKSSWEDTYDWYKKQMKNRSKGKPKDTTFEDDLRALYEKGTDEEVDAKLIMDILSLLRDNFKAVVDFCVANDIRNGMVSDESLTNQKAKALEELTNISFVKSPLPK